MVVPKSLSPGKMLETYFPSSTSLNCCVNSNKLAMHQNPNLIILGMETSTHPNFPFDPTVKLDTSYCLEVKQWPAALWVQLGWLVAVWVLLGTAKNMHNLHTKNVFRLNYASSAIFLCFCLLMWCHWTQPITTSTSTICQCRALQAS